MSIENQKIYPKCQTITRSVEVGGLTKSQLIMKLQENSILLNEYGELLLANEKFTTSDTKYSLETVELTVSNLGFFLVLRLLRFLKELVNSVWDCVHLSLDRT